MSRGTMGGSTLASVEAGSLSGMRLGNRKAQPSYMQQQRTSQPPLKMPEQQLHKALSLAWGWSISCI